MPVVPAVAVVRAAAVPTAALRPVEGRGPKPSAVAARMAADPRQRVVARRSRPAAGAADPSPAAGARSGRGTRRW
jgi:hypothetical protein